jgi:hypothetical protein
VVVVIISFTLLHPTLVKHWLIVLWQAPANPLPGKLQHVDAIGSGNPVSGVALVKLTQTGEQPFDLLKAIRGFIFLVQMALDNENVSLQLFPSDT